ncbi:MAG: SDR family NAD(P)-dependent oxidoreductase [Anaerolineaceae bacterium]|nr:SDR family NAD(P)-dependent oxidoreductase [Anaerolineaceae bacterium]
MALQGQTVLVTGATGFVGGALARRLANDGADVKALARTPEKGHSLRDVPNIEIVQGDITDAERMKAVIQGCDIVFHVAAAIGGTFEFQHKANLDGVRNVMLAAAEAGVKRVVHVSTIAVYGYRASRAVTEATPPNPGRVAYNRTKAEGERTVREIGKERGVSYSIVRPGMIYGPRSNAWTRMLFQVARRKPTPFLGDGSGNPAPIYIDDLIDLMLLMAEHPAAENETFNAVNDPPPTWREFLGGYSQLVGHQAWFGLPVWMGTVVAPLAELVMTLRGTPQDVPALISYVTGQRTYSTAKARELLGWQPKTSLADGIQQCAPWLREKGLLS